MNTQIEPKKFTSKVLVVRNAPAIKLGDNPERIENVKIAYRNTKQGLIDVDDSSINVADIVGIFDEDAFGKDWKQRHGYWLCSLGNLHEIGQRCEDKASCFLKNNEVYQFARKALRAHKKECTEPKENIGVETLDFHDCPTCHDVFVIMREEENRAENIGRKY